MALYEVTFLPVIIDLPDDVIGDRDAIAEMVHEEFQEPDIHTLCPLQNSPS